MVSFSTAHPGINPASKKRRFRALEKPRVYQTYRTLPDGQKETLWMVDGRHQDGERYRLTCHSEAEAHQKAEAQQAVALVQFRLGVSLPMDVLVTAAEAYKEGISVREAVDFFRKNRPKTEPITVAKATDAYVYDREVVQKCEGGVGQMKGLFKRLNTEFGNRMLHELTTDELQKWLIAQQKPTGWRGFQPLGDERRNTLLKTVRALFTFAAAKSRGWVVENHNPAKEIPLIKISRPDACTLSPSETKALLAEVETFPLEFKAAAYLRIFVPLRRCELRKICWENFIDNNLRLEGKGKRKRTIQLDPVAMSWLATVKQPSGPVLGSHPSKLDEHLRAAMTRMGLRPDLADDSGGDQNPTKNILRHSACTYLHLIHGAAKAARLAGHSERIQESHYLGLRTETEAKAWASLLPAKT